MLARAGPPHVARTSPPMVLISDVVSNDNNSGSVLMVKLNSFDFRCRNCLTFLAQHFLDEEGMATTPPSCSKWNLYRANTSRVSWVSTRLIQWQAIPLRARLGNKDLLADVNLSNWAASGWEGLGLVKVSSGTLLSVTLSKRTSEFQNSPTLFPPGLS